MKLSRQGSVSQQELIAMYNPDAFLHQMADTLQASLFRAEDIRAQLCDGTPKVVTATTLRIGRIGRPEDGVTDIVVTLEVQTLVEAVSGYISIYAKQESYDAVDYIVLGAFMEWLKSLDNQGEKDE